MGDMNQIAPWLDTQEWHDAYNKLFLPPYNKKEALNMMYIWKARCPFLPSGIESTISLLEVYIQDVETWKATDGTEQLIRLAYSSAIMRFINHMFDRETSKGSSLYQVAKRLGVPDWIVDLRHDTAHSNNLPSLNLLRQASIVSIEWLQKNYWDKLKQGLGDYIIAYENNKFRPETGIPKLLDFCLSLSIFTHSKSNITNLTQIPFGGLKASLVEDAIELFGDTIDFSDLKNVSIKALKDMLHMDVESIMTTNASFYVKKVLFAKEFPILSEEIYSAFSSLDTLKKSLCKQYVLCFEGLFYFLHTHGLLLDVLLELINVTNSNSNKNKCKLAALWTSEILKALKMSQQFFDKLNKTFRTEEEKKNKDFKLLYYHWYPNERENALLVNLHKPVPQELRDIRFIQPLISTYNPYLIYFIKDMLNMCNPGLPDSVKDKLYTLAEVVGFPEKFTTIESSKIYTVDDVDMSHVNSHSIDADYSSDELGIVSDDKLNNKVSERAFPAWPLASNEHEWANSPIGVLPWQLKGSE